MADEYKISWADLSYITSSLNTISNDLGNGIDNVRSDVEDVNRNVEIVLDDVAQLTQEFREYVEVQMLANRLNQANTNLINIRNRLKDQFGHYDKLRRTVTGILEANDLAIVKSSILSNVTETQMLETPRYWLAPALVALAAWINGEKGQAERALAEAIKRDDEKSSLFFALICRRVGRESFSLKWLARYLEAQDGEKLDRKAVVILDAFASGLLGNDSENFVYKQIQEWMSNLEAKPGFVERQLENWSDAINSKRKPLNGNEYPYLKKYSNTWNTLEDILEGARLNENIYQYFKKIFEQKENTKELKRELDNILNTLVTEFDEEEAPLKREEKFEQLVVEFGGSEKRAKQQMALEKSALEDTRDFMQLLTDASMNPEESKSSVATQKLATALSRDNIVTAFNDVVAYNRSKVPYEIELNVDTFNDVTQAGEDEEEIVERFKKQMDEEKQVELERNKLTLFEQYALYGGIALAVLGLVFLFAGDSKLLPIISIIIGIGMVFKHKSAKDRLAQNILKIEEYYKSKKESGEQILRAVTAEIVDFRMEFKERDAESSKVLDFFEGIKPEEYISRLGKSDRKII